MTERITEKRTANPLFPRLVDSLARNRVVHKVVNSEPVYRALGLGVSTYIRSFQDPTDESRLKLTNEKVLSALNTLDKLAHILIPNNQDRELESRTLETLRREFEKAIETGECTNLTLKIKRTLELMGTEYLKTALLNFGAVGLGLGTLNERFLRKEGKPNFHSLALQTTSACNAEPICQGCYAEKAEGKLDYATLDRVVGESIALTSKLTFVLGGEPLLEKDNLFGLFRKYEKMVFVVATNGKSLDESYARKVTELGNVLTLINIPGLESTATSLRRNPNVWNEIRAAAVNLQKYKAASGFVSTVSQPNFENVSSPEFIQQMIEFGMIVGAYVPYTDPVGCSPKTELTLTPEMTDEFLRRVRWVSTHYPLILIDTSGGAEKKIGGCPAAKRSLVYIQSDGNVGSCPSLPQLDNELNVKTRPLAEILKSPYFEFIRNERPSCVRSPVFLERLQKLPR